VKLFLIIAAVIIIQSCQARPTANSEQKDFFRKPILTQGSASHLDYSSEQKATNRYKRHANAADFMLKTNLFTKGRGIIIAPGMVSLQQITANASKLLTPAFNANSNILKDYWGFNLDEKGQPHGVFFEKYKGKTISVLGCVGCHSGRAAGRFIVGLGNKNIDVTKVGKSLHDVDKVMSIGRLVSQQKDVDLVRVHRDSMEFADLIRDPIYGNLTQGLVPTSTVFTWFYKVKGLKPPEGRARGQAKVPALWGYGIKRKIGQFSDGLGDGNSPGWAVLTELTAGQIPENVLEPDYVKRADEFEHAFGDLLPPRYPFPINDEVAKKGKKHFDAICADCHGSYSRDKDGFPIYQQPQHVPYEIVLTDPDRLHIQTPELVKLIQTSPVVSIMKITNNGKGYFAPRLEGIWARFPYFHNASVPTIADVLTPAHLRPVVFSLKDSGEEHRFDKEKLGLLIKRKDVKKMMQKAAQGARDLYYTRRNGHGNQGHAFGLDLKQNEKRELIEYLKTL